MVTGNVTREEWLSWQRRPRIRVSDIEPVVSQLPAGTRWAHESSANVSIESRYAGAKNLETSAVDGDYFAIKRLDIEAGRVFTAQEQQLGSAVVVDRAGSREALLPESRSDRQGAAAERPALHGHRRHEEPGLRLRLLARPVRHRTVPVHGAALRESAGHGGRSGDPVADRRRHGRINGGRPRPHAGAAPPATVAGRRLHAPDVGVRARLLRQDQGEPGRSRRRAPRLRARGGRHRHHEHHARRGGRAHPGDRHPEGARCAAARHPRAVPGRGGDAEHRRSRDRHPARHRARQGESPPHRRCRPPWRPGRSWPRRCSAPASASSPASIRPVAPPAWIRSPRCGRSDRESRHPALHDLRGRLDRLRFHPREQGARVAHHPRRRRRCVRGGGDVVGGARHQPERRARPGVRRPDQLLHLPPARSRS